MSSSRITKKQFEALQQDKRLLEKLLALRWTEPVLPDLPPPTKGRTEGWCVNFYHRSVNKFWSESHRHGQVGSLLRSPNGIALYSSKLRALKALRHSLELEAANRLHELDVQIALAQAEEEESTNK